MPNVVYVIITYRIDHRFETRVTYMVGRLGRDRLAGIC